MIQMIRNTAARIKNWFRRIINFVRRLFQRTPHMKMRNFNLGYDLVAFLDVLGQRDRFRDLRLPKTPQEAAAVGEVLRQTAGFVLGLRGAFGEQFKSFEAAVAKVTRRTKEPLRPQFVGFSDSFVPSLLLRKEER